VDILPDSRAKTPRGLVMFSPMGTLVPVFCVNCGAAGGHCPEENMTFICYLCAKCAETHGAIAGTLMMPDQVFWERVKQEQIEKYGRVLTAEETARSLEDPLSLESLLAKDRESLTPKPGA
jgi:hypothetical protein